MPDRLLLSGLAFYGRHGVLPAERDLGGRFVVDVEAALDLRPAGAHDDLAATVDYAALYEEVRAVMEGPPLRLIEAVAERIAARLLAAFPPLQAVTVRVHKPGAPLPGATFATIAAEVTRAREAPP
ncbi:MAG TPA: dihydroneopterin aldolase [Chloroflexota bacterium]|nr:dihydroneopterin aldolase [Chloroflexota bacterium]